jgi:hypothetical protein
MPMQWKCKTNALFCIYLHVCFSDNTGFDIFDSTGNLEDIKIIDHTVYGKIYLNYDVRAKGNTNNSSLKALFVINSYSDMFIEEGNDIFQKNNSLSTSTNDDKKDCIFLVKFEEDERENI